MQRGAVGCQQQDAGLLRDEELHGHPSMVPGTYRHRTADKTELFNLPGPSRHRTESKPPGKADPGTMTKTLVKTVMELSDVKEEVYGALDEWAAFEVEFPLVAARKALERPRHQEQWHRIIQVFEQMESFGIKPDKDFLRRAEEAYQQLNMLEKVEVLSRKYALDSKTRRKEKRLIARKALQASKLVWESCVPLLNQILCCETRSLSNRVEQHSSVFQGKQTWASSSIEQRVTEPEGVCNTDFQTDDEDDSVKEQTKTVQGKQTLALQCKEKRVSEPVGGCNTYFQTDADEDSVNEQIKTFPWKQTRALHSKGKRPCSKDND